MEVRITQPGKQSYHSPSVGCAALWAQFSQPMQSHIRHAKICPLDAIIAHDRIKCLGTELILKRVVLLQLFLFSFVRNFFTQKYDSRKICVATVWQHDIAGGAEAKGFFLPFLQSCVACGATAYFMSTCWVELCFQKRTSAQKSGKPWELWKFCFFSVGEWRALLELERCSVFSCVALGTEIESADLNCSERKFSLSEQKRCASEISPILAQELNLSSRISAVAAAQLRNSRLWLKDGHILSWGGCL